MEKQLHKLIIYVSILILATFFTSCDPERFCNEPECLYSDVNVTIDAKLSGNLDSIINIGDTIWLQVKIPDTMQTNYGEIVFNYLWNDSFFGINSGAGDTLIGGTNGNFLNNFEFRQESYLPYQENTGARKWDQNTRNFICYFVPKKKGKYLIFLINGIINLTDQQNRNWKINANLKMDKKARITQYKNWAIEPVSNENINKLILNNNWYCFEVK
jgi:hypothetical protein